MQTVNESIAAQKQIDIKKIVQNLESRRCKLDLELINTKSYKAIVLTDPSQFIIWVNSGFAQMTGYSRKYAVGKKPTFLQGKNTSVESKIALSQQIPSKIAFGGRIIN
ncbi:MULTISPECIES: PAS domain-containing protein [Algoriphagus]|nr:MULTISPECIES: PAS domain-containing protein [Algoriphagus]